MTGLLCLVFWSWPRRNVSLFYGLRGAGGVHAYGPACAWPTCPSGTTASARRSQQAIALSSCRPRGALVALSALGLIKLAVRTLTDIKLKFVAGVDIVHEKLLFTFLRALHQVEEHLVGLIELRVH